MTDDHQHKHGDPGRPGRPMSEETFRVLVESVRDYAIFLLDPDGYVLSWNDLGELGGRFRAADESGRETADRHTREDVAEDQRLAQPHRDRSADERRDERGDEVNDEPAVVHQAESHRGLPDSPARPWSCWSFPRALIASHAAVTGTRRTGTLARSLTARATEPTIACATARWLRAPRTMRSAPIRSVSASS